MKLKDGQDNYYIRERSLGFRWFFTFLLFTQFRLCRDDSRYNLIFLFDEPASNLHQSAQQKLLKALEEITQQSSATIIYTTHSHHLINPNWLESTFIVKNKALDYDHDDNYSSAMTNIFVEKYRTFVGSYPDQRSYFQPILDILEYKPSNIEDIPNVVMVEGKNDFYTYTFFQEVILKRKYQIALMPGCGAGSLDTLISLYYAWGRNFILLLDSDSGGTAQKKRYLEKFGKIIEGKVFSLSDIDFNWTNKGMEKIVESNDRLIIQQSVFPGVLKYDKKSYNLAIQENLIKQKLINVSTATILNIEKILTFLEGKLSENEIANKITNLQVATTKLN